jgi:Na+:H+ antiporter, NhaA family
VAVGIDSLRRVELRAAIILFIAALVAILVANSPVSAGFQALLAWAPIPGTYFSLLHVINDGLMAIFFFVIGLELKKEVIEGTLSNPRKAAQPLIAAAAGMAVPAAIFALATFQNADQLRGWAVPAATDIAFALGALALLGRKVRSELRTFLLALAVADDLGAILVIAFFYANGINGAMLGGACIILVILFGMNRLGVKFLPAYLALGILVWVFMLQSGVHATLAGVLVAFTIPHRSSPSYVNLLQLKLHGFVSYIVMPLFALANAGVPLSAFSISAMSHPVALGAAFGLILGKPIGITIAVYCAAKILKERPVGSIIEMVGLACLAGIGFTMSLFIGGLAYARHLDLFADARAGIFIGSAVSAILGFSILSVYGARRKSKNTKAV